MPLFHLSDRALERNERILTALYLPLVVLLIGAFAIAALIALATVGYHVFF